MPKKKAAKASKKAKSKAPNEAKKSTRRSNTKKPKTSKNIRSNTEVPQRATGRRLRSRRRAKRWPNPVRELTEILVASERVRRASDVVEQVWWLNRWYDATRRYLFLPDVVCRYLENKYSALEQVLTVRFERKDGNGEQSPVRPAWATRRGRGEPLMMCVETDRGTEEHPFKETVAAVVKDKNGEPVEEIDEDGKTTPKMVPALREDDPSKDWEPVLPNAKTMKALQQAIADPEVDRLFRDGMERRRVAEKQERDEEEHREREYFASAPRSETIKHAVVAAVREHSPPRTQRYDSIEDTNLRGIMKDFAAKDDLLPDRGADLSDIKDRLEECFPGIPENEILTAIEAAMEDGHISLVEDEGEPKGKKFCRLPAGHPQRFYEGGAVWLAGEPKGSCAAAEWTTPKGYVTISEIERLPDFEKSGKNPRRTTVDYWIEKDPPEIITNPHTRERCVPHQWVKAHVEQWQPK